MLQINSKHHAPNIIATGQRLYKMKKVDIFHFYGPQSVYYMNITVYEVKEKLRYYHSKPHI